MTFFSTFTWRRMMVMVMQWRIIIANNCCGWRWCATGGSCRSCRSRRASWIIRINWWATITELVVVVSSRSSSSVSSRSYLVIVLVIVLMVVVVLIILALGNMVAECTENGNILQLQKIKLKTILIHFEQEQEFASTDYEKCCDFVGINSNA